MDWSGRMSSECERADEMDDRSAKIERMALSLIELFGDRALEVSERQVHDGNIPSVAAIWQDISDAIRRIETDQ
jgi:hypothetical protein